jgi:DNA-binding NarL/FixJ family response regulator
MPGMKMLIIDDSEGIRRLYIAFFEKKGFTVVGAKNGAEGIKTAQEYAPDITLLDMHLPDMSGLDVLEKLRRLDKDIKILILSGIEDEEEEDRVIKAGALGFISKSADMAQVVDKISRVLN